MRARSDSVPCLQLREFSPASRVLPPFPRTDASLLENKFAIPLRRAPSDVHARAIRQEIFAAPEARRGFPQPVLRSNRSPQASPQAMLQPRKKRPFRSRPPRLFL